MILLGTTYTSRFQHANDGYPRSNCNECMLDVVWRYRIDRVILQEACILNSQIGIMIQ